MIRKLPMALAAVAALCGAAPPRVSPAALPAPLVIDTFDVPADKGQQEVQVVKREFPVGGSSGWHVHPGVETAYVLSGEMLFEMAGQPPRRMHAGDSMTAARGTAHNGTNIGKGPARLLITYVVDKGAPVRQSVPAP